MINWPIGQKLLNKKQTFDYSRNLKLSDAQHCFCQHAQDQTRNQSADHQDSSPSLLLKLQTSSMCLNGRWRGFASATKRLATSMTDPGRADRARQLLETTACWSDCQKPGPCQPPHSSRRSGRQRRLFRQELYVGFLLAMVSTVVLLPRNQR